MPSIATKTAEETNGANREALRGAAVGSSKVRCHVLEHCLSHRAEADNGAASQWGLIAGGLAFAGHFLSPVYRGLTIQFKVYIQMAFMTCGGMIEADRRLRAFEFDQLRQKRQLRHQAVWDRYETLHDREAKAEAEDAPPKLAGPHQNQ